MKIDYNKLIKEFQEWVEAGLWEGEDKYTKNFAVGNVAEWWINKIKEINQIDDDWKKKIRDYLLDEHIHFDKLDPWQFENERPYVDSLKLETFIKNINK